MHRRLSYIILLQLVLILSLCQTLFALDPNKLITQYHIHVYKAKDGLPMNSLKKLFQDSRGFIWIGTQEGLVRFDGVEFKLYDKNGYPGLKSNFIWDIAEDHEGNLWLATNGGGISKFDGKNFTSFDTSNGLANNTANCLQVTKANGLLIATENGWSEMSGNHFTNYYFPKFRNTNNVQSILKDRDGKTYLACYNQSLAIVSQEGTVHLPFLQTIGYIMQRKSGEIILSALEGEVYSLIKKPAPALKLIWSPEPVHKGERIRSIVEDKHGNLWFCTDGGGLVRYRDGKADRLGMANCRLIDNDIFDTALEDKEGSLWFGGIDGLIKLQDNAFTPWGPEEGLCENFCNTVCCNDNGQMCVGFKDSGIALMRGQHVICLNNNSNLADTRISAVYPASNNEFWIAYSFAGLGKTDLNGRITNWKLDNSFEGNQVLSLFQESNGRFWLGAAGRVGQFDGHQFSYYQFSSNNVPGSLTTSMISIHDELWIGTYSEGLYRLKHGQINRHGIPPELLKDGITCLFQDSQGALWIGTDNFGLYRLKNDKYARFIVSDGLFTDRIFAILEDDSMNVWLSSNKGIFRAALAAFKNHIEHPNEKIVCRIFGTLDGMRESECNGRRQPVAWKNRDGKMWFITTAGIVCVDPNHLPFNKMIPPVYIENVKSKNSEYDTKDRLNLQAEERDIEIKYTAPSFTIPERVRFRYRLWGYDIEWNEAQSRRTAYYTNLRRGEYCFQVLACNNDGVWNTEGASLELTIPPFWWETWWARFGYLVCGTALMAIVIRKRYQGKYITAELRMQKEHAAKLEEMNRIKSRFFAGISHEFRTPLTLIKNPLQDMLRENVVNGKRKWLQIMFNNVLRLESLVLQLLDLASLQSGKSAIHAQQVFLLPFINKVIAQFESLAYQKNIVLSVCPQELTLDVRVTLDLEKIEKVIGNLITNALKYTPAFGRIAIHLKDYPSSKAFQDGHVEISVKDTGIGIPPDALPHIFEYFYKYRDEKNYRTPGSGIGLALSQELVQMHHGEIRVKSQENVGSEFTVLLPMGCAHFQSHEIIPFVPERADAGPKHTPAVYGEESKADRHTAGKPLAPATVLLVDDNQDMRLYLQELLDSFYNIIEATDGEEGLHMAESRLPDLIITDLLMPKMDGLEFCNRLKSNKLTSHIPVMVLTAKDDNQSKLKGLQNGAFDYITKPFARDELLLRIRNMLEHSRRLHDNHIKKMITQGLISPGNGNDLSRDDRFLTHAVEILLDNMADSEFGPEQLARRLGLSRAHLNRKIQSICGQHSNEFIRDFRLKQAEELIRAHAGSVTEIAYQVGFNHLSYFAKSFKARYGISPSEYSRSCTKVTSNEQKK